ncbi:MAG: hypothetical protein WA052_02195 [Microgenomates group bacterium]
MEPICSLDMTEFIKRPGIEPVSVDSSTKERMIESTKTAFEIAKMVTGKHAPVYLYGGAVRNMLLGQPTSDTDFDFIGNFNLDQIEKDFPGLVVGRWDAVSTLRLEIGSSIYDFTGVEDIYQRLSENDINTSLIFMDESGNIFDCFGGIESLNKKEIRIVDPDKKIISDPSRILRVFRFATELDFSIEEETLASTIRNAHLLKQAKNLDDDLWEIVTLEPNKRADVLKSLRQYGIDRFLEFPEGVLEAVNVYELEKEIQRFPQIEEVSKMFNTDAYLVGGAVRDLIWGKKINDLDFKIKLPVSEIIRILEERGFEKSPDYHTSEGQYYVSTFTGVAGAVINGIDIHLTAVESMELSPMIDTGDVNFSCCIYNANTRKIVNPEIIKDIQEKRLYFCNIENANEDPLIVVNALKQISKLPDVVIPQETDKVIKSNIPRVIQYFEENPEMIYILESICGNLNSEEALSYFGIHTEVCKLLANLPEKKSKLLVSGENYLSLTLDELSPSDKSELIELIKSAFGKKYDSSKEFPERINSVVFERKAGEIVACGLVDGERVYVASAKRGYGWINIFTNLAKNNYNVWCTVDSANPKIQALCSLGGLTIETDPTVMRKMLVNKGGKDNNSLEIYEQNGLLVFRDKNKSGYSQVLLRS